MTSTVLSADEICAKIDLLMSKFGDFHKVPLPQLYIDRHPEKVKAIHPSLKTTEEMEELKRQEEIIRENEAKENESPLAAPIIAMKESIKCTIESGSRERLVLPPPISEIADLKTIDV